MPNLSCSDDKCKLGDREKKMAQLKPHRLFRAEKLTLDAWSTGLASFALDWLLSWESSPADKDMHSLSVFTADDGFAVL